MKSGNYFFAQLTRKTGTPMFHNVKVLKRYFDDKDNLMVELIITYGFAKEMYDNHESRKAYFTPIQYEHDNPCYAMPSDILLWVPNHLMPLLDFEEQISFYVFRHNDRDESGELLSMCAWGFQIAEYDDENIGLDYDEMMAESDEE